MQGTCQPRWMVENGAAETVTQLTDQAMGLWALHW